MMKLKQTITRESLTFKYVGFRKLKLVSLLVRIIIIKIKILNLNRNYI